MDAQRRARQAELVGHPGRDVVLLVGDHDLELAHSRDEVGPRHHVLLIVGRIVHAGENADVPGVHLGHAARRLESFPAGLEEQALLRVHELRFLGVDAEEGGVEALHVGQNTARGDVGGVVSERGVDGRVELRGCEAGDRVAAFQEVAPQLVHVHGAREAAGEADDGHGLRRRRSPATSLFLEPGTQWLLAAGGEHARQAFHRRILEEPDGGQIAALLAETRQRSKGEQRVATELEEIVEHAYARQTQLFREDLAERGLEGRAGSHVLDPQLRSIRGGLRQRPEIDLAVGGDGEGALPHESGRDHVLGQVLAEPVPKCGGVRSHAGLCGDTVGHEALSPVRRGPGGDHAGLDRRVPREDGLDLSRLDAKPADLELLVGAAQVVDRPVRSPPDDVAGTVEPFPGVQGVGDEALGRQLGALSVAAGEPFAANVELSRDPHGDGPPQVAQDVDARVPDRAADRHRTGLGVERRRDPVDRRERGALSRPVAVEQLDVGQRLLRSTHVGGRQRLAAGEQLTKPAKTRRVLVHDRVEQGGREPRGGDAVTADGGGQTLRGRDGLGVQRAAPAREQGAPDLECRSVERQGSGVEERVPWPQLDVVHVADQAVHRAVGDLGALRLSRRARGVGDVGQVPGGGLRFRAIHALAGEAIAEPVEAHHLGRRARQQGLEAGVRQDHGGPRVGQHEGHALLRVGRLEREIGPARLENAQQGDHGVDRPLEAHRHGHVRSDPQPLKRVRQLVGEPVDLGVARRSLPVEDRGRVGTLGHLVGEEVRDGRLRSVVRTRLVPGDQYLLALLLRQEVDFTHPNAGRGEKGLQPEAEVRHNSVGDPWVEATRVEVELEAAPGEAALQRQGEAVQCGIGGDGVVVGHADDTLEEGGGGGHLAPALDALQGGYRERPRPLPISLGRHDPFGQRHLRVDRGAQGQDRVGCHHAAEQDVSLARVEREKNRPDALQRSTGTGASVRGEALETPVRVRRQGRLAAGAPCGPTGPPIHPQRRGCGEAPENRSPGRLGRGLHAPLHLITSRSIGPVTPIAAAEPSSLPSLYSLYGGRRVRPASLAGSDQGMHGSIRTVLRPDQGCDELSEPICVLCRPFAARNSYRHVARSVCEPP